MATIRVRKVPPGGLDAPELRPRHADGRTVYVGDDVTDAGSDPQAVQQWTAQVTAQGLVATRMPSGMLKGQLATRLKTPDPTKGWDYQLAPYAVRQADIQRAIEDQITITAGQIAAALQAASLAVLQAPGNALSLALGVPKWVLWVGGAVVVTVVLVTVSEQYLPRGRRRLAAGA